MMFAAVQNKTIGSAFNFRVRVLLKKAVRKNLNSTKLNLCLLQGKKISSPGFSL